MTIRIPPVVIAACALASVGMLSAAAAEAPGAPATVLPAHLVAVFRPTRLDYVALASLADSTRLMALPLNLAPQAIVSPSINP